MTRFTEEQAAIAKAMRSTGTAHSTATKWHPLSSMMASYRRMAELTVKNHPGRREITARDLAICVGRLCMRPGDLVGQEDLDRHASGIGIATKFDPPVWYVRPSACAVVEDTDLHSIPTAPPKMLRSAGIVQARRPETGERLFNVPGGNPVAALGWYHDGGSIMLVGTMYPSGHAVTVWRPEWTGAELEAQLPGTELVNDRIEDREAHAAFSRYASRFLVVLSLLAESEPSPLRIELDRKAKSDRHVYVNENVVKRRADHLTPSATGAERVVVAADVTGHIKRQRHGPGYSLTKWIYVAGYSARRYHAPHYIVEKK